MIIVYVTCSNKAEAQRISKALLEKRLVACTNYRPVDSMYWWEGRIQKDNEYILITKTVKKNFKRIKEQIEKLHSYDIPCILSWDVRGNKGYIDWVNEEIR